MMGRTVVLVRKPPRVVALLKADVRNPGSRGGKFRRTKSGKVIYGDRPSGGAAARSDSGHVFHRTSDGVLVYGKPPAGGGSVHSRDVNPDPHVHLPTHHVFVRHPETGEKAFARFGSSHDDADEKARGLHSRGHHVEVYFDGRPKYSVKRGADFAERMKPRPLFGGRSLSGKVELPDRRAIRALMEEARQAGDYALSAACAVVLDDEPKGWEDTAKWTEATAARAVVDALGRR